MDTVIVNGLFLGIVYGLLGVGLVVVYRGSRVINFAYGETGMAGAFVFSELWVSGGLPILVAIAAGVAASAVIGGLTEVLVVRPLRSDARLTVMVGTFAVASLLIVYCGRRYGLNPRFLPPIVSGAGFTFGGVTVTPAQLLIALAAILLLTGLWALYRYTSFGLRLRATAIDAYAAGQVGIDINRTSLATWALAGAIAGLSAILIAPLVAFNVFFMTSLIVRGIAAALVGGLTSISGAFAAGVSLGVAEAVIAYTSPVSGIVEVSLALLIIVMLLVRPAGLVRSAY